MYLAIKLPRKYWETFKDYVDIYIPWEGEEYPSLNYILLNPPFDLTMLWEIESASYTILWGDTVKETWRKVWEYQAKIPRANIIPTWMGYKKDLDNLRKEFKTVALPWWRPRNLYLDEGEGKNLIYLGYKNLDELYRNPPKILISGIAFHAAVSGIDLKDRERRPTKLKPFTGTLTEEQIKEVKKNLKILKGAKNG